MVKIIIEQPHCNFKCDDDPIMTATELGVAIGGIYQGFKNNDSDLKAEAFRLALLAAMSQDSPIWKEIENMVSIIIPQKKSGAPTDQS